MHVTLVANKKKKAGESVRNIQHLSFGLLKLADYLRRMNMLVNSKTSTIGAFPCERHTLLICEFLSEGLKRLGGCGAFGCWPGARGSDSHASLPHSQMASFFSMLSTKGFRVIILTGPVSNE